MLLLNLLTVHSSSFTTKTEKKSIHRLKGAFINKAWITSQFVILAIPKIQFDI